MIKNAIHPAGFATEHRAHRSVRRAGSWTLALLAAGPLVAAQDGPTDLFPNTCAELFSESGANASGDLNGDGFEDLVVGYGVFDDRISVLLGKGDGSFESRVDYAAATPFELSIEDIDGDGDPDILASEKWLAGNGDGTFVVMGALASGVGNRPKLVDVDGDGLRDLVGLFLGVTVAKGLGGGQFGPTQTVSGNLSGDFVLGDVDQDGFQDVLVADALEKELVLLRGNGDGTFQAPQVVRLGTGYDLLLADFDSDGRLDLAANWAPSFNPITKLRIFLGNGDGTFKQGLANQEARRIVAEDLDGDGVLDIFGTAFGQGLGIDLSVFLGVGDGAFQPVADYRAGGGLGGVHAGDFDEDGVLDIAAFQSFEDGVGIVKGLGDGTFAQEPRTPFQSSSGLREFAVGDFDGDERPDLAVATSLDDLNVLLWVDGFGDFSTSSYTDSDFGQYIDVADLDADGNDDLLGITPLANLQVRLSMGDGTFGALNSYPGPVGPYFVIADVHGDGILDVVHAVSISGITVRPGVGDGTLGAPQVDPWLGSWSSIEACDLDFDGDADLVLGDLVELAVLLSNGDGTFQAPQSYPMGGRDMAIADVDMDGVPDVLAGTSLGEVAVWFGVGDGTLLPGPVTSELGSCEDLRVADINGDGHLDLACTSGIGNGSFSIALGNGDGSFQSPFPYLDQGRPTDLELADVSCNGRLDVITSHLQTSDIAVHFNQLDPAPPTPYCSAKLSSGGCAASIATFGSTIQPCSGSADYSLVVTDVQAGANALVFAGTSGGANLPFLGGTLCVQPPLKRGPLFQAGGQSACSGSLSLLVNDGQAFPLGLDAGPGSSAWYQVLYRDNGAGATFGSALSDAIQLDFQ